MVKNYYTYTIDNLRITYFGGDHNEYSFKGTNQQAVIDRMIAFTKLLPDFNPVDYSLTAHISQIECDDKYPECFSNVKDSNDIIHLSIPMEKWLAEYNTNPDQTTLEV